MRGEEFGTFAFFRFSFLKVETQGYFKLFRFRNGSNDLKRALRRSPNGRRVVRSIAADRGVFRVPVFGLVDVIFVFEVMHPPDVFAVGNVTDVCLRTFVD